MKELPNKLTKTFLMNESKLITRGSIEENLKEIIQRNPETRLKFI